MKLYEANHFNRNDSTKRNVGMEFTKPVDSEQRMADPWIKKMQEISRQEREKWAAYRRNVKLTLDNVEETTKAGKLTNNESITVRTHRNCSFWVEHKINQHFFCWSLYFDIKSLRKSLKLRFNISCSYRIK